ncbi:MAG: hypothetical protein QXO03_03565 [Thermoplasmatales archaeon]
MILPSVTIKKRKIVESDSLLEYASGPLWVIDEDFKDGRELNFSLYDDLSALYNLYLDAELGHVDDVEDALTAGAHMVTVTERTNHERLREILSITESAIFYVRGDSRKAYYFLQNGGAYVFSDNDVIEGAKVQFTSKLRCENCYIVVPIGDLNGGRNKEASSLP